MEYDENDLKRLRELAEAGNSDAQVQLGHCYRNGDIVKGDDETAVMWYRRAADQGDEMGIRSLVICYNFGFGVPRDPKKQMFWTRKAAMLGSREDQEMLGDAYHEGYGLKKDDRKAAYWYRKANALLKLANLYYEGAGVRQDYRKAFRIYRRLRDENRCLGDDNYYLTKRLAECYEFGRGTAIDLEKAFLLCDLLVAMDTCEADHPEGWEPPCREQIDRVKAKLRAANGGKFPELKCVEV